jgi:hypothetical protein
MDLAGAISVVVPTRRACGHDPNPSTSISAQQIRDGSR